MSVIEYHIPLDQPAVTLSDAAVQHVAACLSKQPAAIGVRFSVKKTGCSGLSYVVDYVHELTPGDVLLPLGEYPQYQVCIDITSYAYLKNMHVDYVKQGLNQRWVFTNPNQTGQCGCGESFTVAPEFGTEH